MNACYKCYENYEFMRDYKTAPTQSLMGIIGNCKFSVIEKMLNFNNAVKFN